MFERRVDDFLTKWGIAHQVEPVYPYHPTLNAHAMRADRRLDDGTHVEAWGLMGAEAYNEKRLKKKELARVRGIRLVGLVPEDLPNLTTVFSEWIQRH